MEARKILIIDSKNQAQKSFMSTATTLGALKSEMRELNINYGSSVFYCGEMRAELVDDDSPLPETVMYRGELKRDLTFMLTTPNKKIKSGTMSRLDVYRKIKEFNLQESCKAKYGKNFTQCSTVDLIKLVEENTTIASVEKDNVNNTTETKISNEEVKDSNKIMEAFNYLIDCLYNSDYIDDYNFNRIKSIIDNTSKEDKIKPSKDKMSKDEIDSMFDFIKK